MKALKKNDLGVSPVIAVILMVAITVVLAGVVFLWAQSFTEDTGDTVQTLSVDMELTTDGGAPPIQTLSITSLKGEIDWADYTVLVAGVEIAGQSVVAVDPGVAETFLIVSPGEATVAVGDSYEIQIVSIADQTVIVKTDVTCTAA